MLSYSDLLAKIYEDEKIEFVLESMECHNIHSEQGGKLIVATLPDGDNKRSIQVKNIETLRVSVRSRGMYGNLYDLVMYIMKHESIKQSYEYLLNICGYDDNTVYIENPLNWLNKLKRQRRTYSMEFENLKILDNNILNQYIYGGIKQFEDDGISRKTLQDYMIGYDVFSRRITIPIYDIDGNLCGVKGRATNKQDEDEYKFMFLYPTDQSKTMYNFHRAKEYCKQIGEVNVFESEKATMQAKDCGIMNAVGIGSSNISIEQLNILLSLQCDINLCFDKGLDLNMILPNFECFFNGKRSVYYIVDRDSILKDKSSPIDEGKDVFDYLYQDRMKLC